MSTYNLKDLQEIQGQTNRELSESSVQLCYHLGKCAYVRPLKLKDKKDLLKSMESKNLRLINKNFDQIIQLKII